MPITIHGLFQVRGFNPHILAAHVETGKVVLFGYTQRLYVPKLGWVLYSRTQTQDGLYGMIYGVQRGRRFREEGEKVAWVRCLTSEEKAKYKKTFQKRIGTHLEFW